MNAWRSIMEDGFDTLITSATKPEEDTKWFIHEKDAARVGDLVWADRPPVTTPISGTVGGRPFTGVIG
jgi:hypothetical protein